MARRIRVPSNLRELKRFKEELAAHEISLIEKGLSSNSPSDLVEAHTYIKNIEEKTDRTTKSFEFAPEMGFYSGLGYKNKTTSLSYELLRGMARVPQINTIIQTRIDQAMNYSQFSIDTQKPGWTIQKRLGKFATDKDKELSDLDKKEIETIVNWLESGGSDVPEWDGKEDFSEFMKAVYKDSWELDQGCFEVSWRRKGIPHQYQSVDAATIRLAEDLDTNEIDSQKKEVNGYQPKYVQVWKSQVYHEFYPWELCMGMRNKTTNVFNNGYSTSEIEILIQIVTWMLNGMQYNGNFFQQGSNPKGILNIKGNVDAPKLDEFRQAWRSTVSGVQNSHKLAVTSGTEMEWIDMQQTNKDMEFHEWNEFLTVLSCTVFRIDPSEAGFNLKNGNSTFGQDGQKERLKHSREKGLEPFLRYWQTQFDKYLVKPLSKGKYEFVFTGINPEDETLSLEKDVKILTNGGMSIEDFFMKYSSRKLDWSKDSLLNQIALQYKTQQQSGSDEANQQIDEQTGEDNNPFNQFRKGEEDPFMKAFVGYAEKVLTKQEE